MIYLVLVNWNCAGESRDCIVSLCTGGSVVGEVVVVDNASTESLEPLHDLRRRPELGVERLSIVELEENRGFGAGVNAAIDDLERRRGLGSGDALLICNPDVDATPAAVRELADVAAESDAWIVGSAVSENAEHRTHGTFDGASLPWEFFHSGLSRRSSTCAGSVRWSETGMASGCFMLLSGAAVESLRESRGAVFREDLFMYCEELDLCAEVWSRGGRVVTACRSEVGHGSDAEVGSAKEKRKAYYITRNTAHVARDQLAPGWRALFELVYPALYLSRVVVRALSGERNEAGATLAGVADSYRGVVGRVPEYS